MEHQEPLGENTIIFQESPLDPIPGCFSFPQASPKPYADVILPHVDVHPYPNPQLPRNCHDANRSWEPLPVVPRSIVAPCDEMPTPIIISSWAHHNMHEPQTIPQIFQGKRTPLIHGVSWSPSSHWCVRMQPSIWDHLRTGKWRHQHRKISVLRRWKASKLPQDVQSYEDFQV